MNAPSFLFLGFAIVGAVLFNLSGAVAWRRSVLLVLNVVFFAQFAPGLTGALPYIGFLAAGYVAIIVLRKHPSQAVFLPFLALILFIFFWLKHYTFIPSNISLPLAYTTIGLSYVFFRVLHLVIDVRQRAIAEHISPLSYLNYTLHFPALIAGPIQLYPDYCRMESSERPGIDIFILGQATWRIALGFFKVIIVSALMMQIQQICIAALVPNLSFAERAFYCGIIGATYPFFLYANFSGYVDFVIGVAHLYRFTLPENFDNPFVAENFIVFWSRWHITLSNWLKMYVYVPVLMTCMRRVPSRRAEPYFGVLAYFITFFLVGAWHGQTSMFLFFGILQGGGVAVNKAYQIAMTNLLSSKRYRELCRNFVYSSLSRGLTFTWFAFTLLWFWSSWQQLGTLVGAATIFAFIVGWFLVFVAASLGLAGLVAIQRLAAPYTWLQARYVRTVAVTAMMMVVIIWVAIVAGPAPDIVYKNF